MSRLSDDVISTVCFFIGTSPHLTASQLIEKVYTYHDVEITAKDLERIMKEEREEIDKYRLGGTYAVQKGLRLGTLPYASLMERIKTLGDIVKMGIEGYEEERMTARGEIAAIQIRNLPASLDALKQLHQLMGEVDSLEEEEFEQPVGIFPDMP